MPNEFAEVLVSEQTAMSIKVTVAPQISGGLAALAEKLLRAEATRKDRGKGRKTSNKLVGEIHGTVLQIGTVKNMNMPDGR
ncbi:hypothetical protein [Lentzea sp. NEAU-D7]|uniref:hypothetical protein n=1 Tax=Lentzea sp. NEAU-D7 TaxID=2994667 RepID=UPI00224AD9AD|nr:hypothetical protein [Lentzea sp. NEAU-D7]MCX2949786.1 hypothetical protein [Lentzea sp. NEAU-D7]MCX2951086.1 hypothetical protein [Lentzea sp. NEAU-D7]